VEWRGHSLTLVLAYLPSEEAAGQRAFFTVRLALAAGVHGRLVLGFFSTSRPTLAASTAGDARAPRSRAALLRAGVVAGVCRLGAVIVNVF
jgi:hypothetical protein